MSTNYLLRLNAVSAGTSVEHTLSYEPTGTHNKIKLFAFGDFGASGKGYLEVQDSTGTFQRYAELTFSSKTAQQIELFDNAVVRLVIENATSASMEIYR